MCGRYTLTSADHRALGARFGAAMPEGDEGFARFNVAPTETAVAVVRDKDGGLSGQRLRWSLVPGYAKDLKGPPLFNARAETVASKAPFAKRLASPRGRCLILADGFYEWLRPEDRTGAARSRRAGRADAASGSASAAPSADAASGTASAAPSANAASGTAPAAGPLTPVPFRFTVDGGAPFAFAGLWGWSKPGGEWLASCTIITTTPNPLVARLHDRMPVILPGPEAEAAWLSPELAVEDAGALLVPLAASRMASAPANPRVNKSGLEDEGADLLQA